MKGHFSMDSEHEEFIKRAAEQAERYQAAIVNQKAALDRTAVAIEKLFHALYMIQYETESIREAKAIARQTVQEAREDLQA